MNSLRGGLLEANNATGDMPTGSAIIVIHPCQKRLLSFILDQDVNVDQRSYAAEEKEDLFGEALAGELVPKTGPDGVLVFGLN